ncbi:arginase family protein [Serratia sp. NPDC078593]|uniref:arginase family protein n=1 Tax=unclassified Serratia (in: enterobacteria) TaxID=2647522 RepID=UPI0037D1E425
MMYQIICSQGRVGDKTDSTLRGAKLTADLLEQKLGMKATFLGNPSPGKDDTWETCLPEAATTLTQLQSELRQDLERAGTSILALNTCSTSLATLPAVVAKHPDVKILWIDAHGDFNTPSTSETGYLGGMVLGAVCGLWQSGYGAGVKPEQVVLVGAHDIDEKERELLTSHNIKIIPPKNVTPDEIVKVIGNSKVWIHIDWDVLEPGEINADYKVHGGICLAQLVETVQQIPREQVLGLELAEFSADDVDSALNKKSLSNILSVVDALFLK